MERVCVTYNQMHKLRFIEYVLHTHFVIYAYHLLDSNYFYFIDDDRDQRIKV